MLACAAFEFVVFLFPMDSPIRPVRRLENICIWQRVDAHSLEKRSFFMADVKRDFTKLEHEVRGEKVLIAQDYEDPISGPDPPHERRDAITQTQHVLVAQ